MLSSLSIVRGLELLLKVVCAACRAYCAFLYPLLFPSPPSKVGFTIYSILSVVVEATKLPLNVNISEALRVCTFLANFAGIA